MQPSRLLYALVALSLSPLAVSALPTAEHFLEERLGAIQEVQPIHGRDLQQHLEERLGAIQEVQPIHGSDTPGRRELAEAYDKVALEKRIGAISRPQPFHGNRNQEAGNGKKRSEGMAVHRYPSLNRRANVCNGDTALCAKLYSNVTFIGSHNSYAVGKLSQAAVGYNQQKPVTTQLDDGIRLLQVQAHTSTNATGASGIDLCHSSCSIVNGGSLESYLSTVKSWVDKNPTEVITLLIVNSDDNAVSRFATAFESTGLSSKAFTPSSSTSGAISKSSWPTLGSMIDAGTTVVTFIDNSADTSSVPYILPEFTNIWENPYDQTSYPFSCKVDRIDSNYASSPADLMYLTNHYLDQSVNLGNISFDIPNISQIYTTNSQQSIAGDAGTCAVQHGSYPNFVLLDFYDTGYGGAFQSAAAMNGVQYVNSTTSGGSSGSNGSSGSDRSSSAGGGSSAAAKLSLGAGSLLLASAGVAASLLF